jgi:hypothetical protein
VLHILEDREFGVAEAIPLTWKPSKGKLEEQEHDDENS